MKLTQTPEPTMEGRNQKKKRFNLEAWEKETSVSFLKKEKAEKSCTDERTN